MGCIFSCNINNIKLQDRWKSIIKFSLGFLSNLQPQLLKIDITGITKLFKESIRNGNKDLNQIILNYHRFVVKNKELDDLKEKYFIEMVKNKLSVIEILKIYSAQKAYGKTINKKL